MSEAAGASAFDLRQLDYELPEERIAQAPLEERESARLLCLVRDGTLAHRSVRDLPDLLPPSLIVLNDTRVLPARLFGSKPSGGKLELLLFRRLSEPGWSERWLALGKGLRVGLSARLAEGALELEVCARRDDAYEVTLSAERGVGEVLAQHGLLPLPPYIKRLPDTRDAERYQTVFAVHEGAVAAPTAGLHLSTDLLERLRARGHELVFVTLHVGPGTFLPLRTESLFEHRLHEEHYTVPEATANAVARARAAGRRVLAVGTTVVRALESAATPSGEVRPGEGATTLFIHPPYAFRVVDALMTNFHLPRSTLLALVMAFGGVEPVRRAYEAAIGSGYRFYSYGDAMLLGAAQ
ncbi:MAG: tRNA preQ1(34) S-adenosylmethionine ribosyltransferase-isomerase QueA [Polyangiales bacterium]